MKHGDSELQSGFRSKADAERWLAMALDAVWNEGYRVGYESPDMPIDYTPLSPYSPDRTEEDA